MFKNAEELRELITTLAKKENVGVLISSHNLAELEQICNQIAVIRAGKLLSFRAISRPSERI